MQFWELYWHSSSVLCGKAIRMAEGVVDAPEIAGSVIVKVIGNKISQILVDYIVKWKI